MLNPKGVDVLVGGTLLWFHVVSFELNVYL